MNKHKYINKKFIIIAAIAGVLAPILLFGVSITDTSPIPAWLSYILVGLPYDVINKITGLFGFAVVIPGAIFSAIYYASFLSLLRALIIWIREQL